MTKDVRFPSLPTARASRRGRSIPGSILFALGVLTGVVLTALLVMQSNRTAYITTDTSAERVARARPATPDSKATPAAVVQKPHELLPEATDSLDTVGGPLVVVPGGGEDRLTLNGHALGLPGPRFSLLSVSRHTDQDIVLVGMKCGGASCVYLDLAFVRVFKNSPPVVEMRPGFRIPMEHVAQLKQGIDFRAETTTVALGLDRGASVSARIGPDLAFDLTREAVAARPLSRQDCLTVMEAIDACAAFSKPCRNADFQDFPKNCPSAPRSLYRSTIYLTDHTTGLDLPAFAHTCARASQLHIAPSDEFVATEICSGANARQWRQR